MLPLLLLACAAPEPGTDTAGVGERVPTLTDATVACDDDAAEWTFTADADAWTGNGQVVLSTDGVYVEKHTMYSTEAASDGSADHLALELDVVPDWRDVSGGSSTVFNCDEPELTGVLRIWTRDGEDEADCVAFGEAPERWAEWDVGVSCDEVLATEE